MAVEIDCRGCGRRVVLLWLEDGAQAPPLCGFCLEVGPVLATELSRHAEYLRRILPPGGLDR